MPSCLDEDSRLVGRSVKLNSSLLGTCLNSLPIEAYLACVNEGIQSGAVVHRRHAGKVIRKKLNRQRYLCFTQHLAAPMAIETETKRGARNIRRTLAAMYAREKEGKPELLKIGSRCQKSKTKGPDVCRALAVSRWGEFRYFDADPKDELPGRDVARGTENNGAAFAKYSAEYSSFARDHEAHCHGPKIERRQRPHIANVALIFRTRSREMIGTYTLRGKRLGQLRRPGKFQLYNCLSNAQQEAYVPLVELSRFHAADEALMKSIGDSSEEAFEIDGLPDEPRKPAATTAR